MPNYKLYQSSDPLVRGSQLCSDRIGEAQCLHILRPVWLIGDLQILYEWLRSPVKKSNWSLPPKGSLFQHYHYSLLARAQQSLLVEAAGQPLIQFDLFPVPCDLHAVDIRYLFRQYFRDPPAFENGLSLLLKYLGLVATVARAQVVLPGEDQSMERALRKFGFEKSLPDPGRPRAILFQYSFVEPGDKTILQYP